MTKIKFFKKQDIFTGFEFSGHTGYAEYGKDILCATISGISQSCLIGLKNILKINPRIKIDNNSGYLKIELPNKLESKLLEQSSLLIEVVYESIKDLMKGYSNYISMEVIENDY